MYPELYGTWENPATTNPYDAPVPNKIPLSQIKITSVAKNANNVIVTYRTEGCKDVGTKVVIFIKDANNVTVDSQSQAINQKWDNEQTMTFQLPAPGAYQVYGRIGTDDSYPNYFSWQTIVGKPLSIP
ncbi:MAG: hypothetical protein ACYC26_05890 [Phycisphaerales bacterium]